ncbi:hypothetical protein [Cupriavidus respiraculi]|uniref:hypothetical protein n=1 Tax=Cupriavidus respiraculi TaxID=195930 RepID=UPI001F37225E|nr:hypothetical protein [Cupriavidus respiraculi]
MEHLIRIQNEYDRQVLVWLRARIGDTALESVARRLGGERKPYLSMICRTLNIRPPSRSALRAQQARINREVGDRYLASIRKMLAEGPAARDPRPSAIERQSRTGRAAASSRIGADERYSL